MATTKKQMRSIVIELHEEDLVALKREADKAGRYVNDYAAHIILSRAQ